MASYRDNLLATRNQIAERLAEVTAEKAPSYSVGGQSISWESYTSMLIGNLDKVEQALQRADQPFWKVSRARP